MEVSSKPGTNRESFHPQNVAIHPRKKGLQANRLQPLFIFECGLCQTGHVYQAFFHGGTARW